MKLANWRGWGIRSSRILKAAALTLAVALVPVAGKCETGAPSPSRWNTFDTPSVPVSQFGASLDVHNGRAIVGAPTSDSEGRVFIYDLASGSEVMQLVPDNLGRHTHYGKSVRMSDRFALVAANLGREVYLFDSQTGQQIQRWSPQAPQRSSLAFGTALYLNDEISVIGDPGNVVNSVPTGAAYIFDNNSGALIDRLTLQNPTHISAGFGKALDLDGDRLVIGAPGEPGNSTSDGKAIVYDVATRSRLLTLTANDTVGTAGFGEAIAIDEDLVLIGAPGTGTGAAYLFDLNTGEQLYKFTSPSPNANNFGYRVALHDGYALIGDPFHNSFAGDIYAGSAYLFDVETRQLVTTFLPDEPQQYAHFADSLDFEGHLFAFGAHGVNGVNGRQGTVYYTTYIPEPSTYFLLCVGVLLSWLLTNAKRGN